MTHRTPSPPQKRTTAQPETVHDKSLSSLRPCRHSRDRRRLLRPGNAPKGVAAKTAGYSPEELAAATGRKPSTNSFGCGNPLAFSGSSPRRRRSSTSVPERDSICLIAAGKVG